MVVGFITTYAINAYHHYSCEFEPRSLRGVLDTTLFDKVCQGHATDRWFSPGIPVSSTNKTDRHDITEMLLKVALNTIVPHGLIINFQHLSFSLFSLRFGNNIFLSPKS